MTTRLADWEGDTLVLRLPFAEFAAAMEFIGSESRRYRIEDPDALKAFLAEQAFRVSAFDVRHEGNIDAITEWVDLLMQLAAKNAAGIRTVRAGKGKSR